jgi:arsenite-transporting ATPase
MRTKLFVHEMIGRDHLIEMADSIYGREDPSTIFFHGVSQRLLKVGNAYELRLQLPFVGKEDVDITHREGELYVSVGPYKREIALPRVLNGKKVTRGKLEEGMLSVTFASEPR